MILLLCLGTYLGLGLFTLRTLVRWNPKLYQPDNYDLFNGTARALLTIVFWWVFLIWQVIERSLSGQLQIAAQERQALVQHQKEVAAAMRELEGLPERRKRDDSYYEQHYHRRVGDRR